MQTIILNECQVTSRRRGFEVVSRLARQTMAPGRRVAEANPDEWARQVDSTTHEPRHRREDSTAFRLQLSADLTAGAALIGSRASRERSLVTAG